MGNDKLTNSIKAAYKLAEKTRYELWNALDSLQVFAPPDAPDWKDELIGNSRAEIINGDILKIYVPEYFPKNKELITSEFKGMWFMHIRSALKQLAERPFYEKAFVFIEIHTKNPKLDWDVDNKAVSLVINSLKGTLFKNDSYQHLSYGVRGCETSANETEEYYTNIYIMDYEKYIKNALPFLSRT